MDKLTRFYKLLTDETRIRILILLKHKKLCVCQLCSIMEEPQPKISKHLAKLRDLGLIKDERSEQFIFYFLNTEDSLYLNTLVYIVEHIDEYPTLKHDLMKSEDADNYITCKHD